MTECFDLVHGGLTKDHTEGDRITAQFEEWGIPLRGHTVVWSISNHNPDWFEANPKIEDLNFRIDDIIGRNKGPGFHKCKFIGRTAVHESIKRQNKKLGYFQ